MEEASYSMDRPPGGWPDLVTNHTLDLHLQAFRHELIVEMERRFRTQTWALVSTILASAGLLGVLARI